MSRECKVLYCLDLVVFYVAKFKSVSWFKEGLAFAFHRFPDRLSPAEK